MSGVGIGAGAGATSYNLPYMTSSPTELSTSPQLWNAQGKNNNYYSFKYRKEKRNH